MGIPPGYFPHNIRGLRDTVQVPYNPGKFNRRQGPMRKVGRGTCGGQGERAGVDPGEYRTRDSDIPVTHGAEMLVLRAEAALRAGDIAGMTTLLNESLPGR